MSLRREEYAHWIEEGNMYIHPFEPPLGIGALSAYLKEKGFGVESVDMVGLMMQERALESLLRQKKPSAVGITAMTPTLPFAKRIAGLVKQVLPSAKVILGGVHATVSPESCFEDENIDFVLRGEGELSIEALLSRGLHNELVDIPGLCRRNGGISSRGIATPVVDLDCLPVADYDSFPIERYIAYNESLRGIRGISMLISRGCPYPCSFCAVHQTMGKKFRIKAPEKVVDEMRRLTEKYLLEGIWFKDSIFNQCKEWFFAFCSELKRRRMGLSWQCNTRVDLANEAELAAGKEAGLVQIDLGIESGSPKSLKTLAKGIDVDQVERAVQRAKKYVKVAGFFMIGIPGETREDIEMTFDFAKKLNLDKYTWSLFSPLPGSMLYEDLREHPLFTKQIKDFEAIHFTENPYSFCEVPPEELREIYRQINEHFSQGRKTSLLAGNHEVGNNEVY